MAFSSTTLKGTNERFKQIWGTSLIPAEMKI